MGPPSYMRSVVVRNVVRRRIPVYKCVGMSRVFGTQVNPKVLCLSVAHACRTRERECEVLPPAIQTRTVGFFRESRP